MKYITIMRTYGAYLLALSALMLNLLVPSGFIASHFCNVCLSQVPSHCAATDEVRTDATPKIAMGTRDFSTAWGAETDLNAVPVPAACEKVASHIISAVAVLSYESPDAAFDVNLLVLQSRFNI